ncbi:MAG: hypothetical protein H0V01_05960 [Bacteroidetes bacterium]|nr:hypothetical protein [Bacteroidota bacterium]
MYLDITRSTPSFSTAMLWVKKIGYSQLEYPKEKADDWIIIADESIGIGQEKVLVILCIRRSKIDFTRPLKLQDMKPIVVKSKERWTGEDIANELEIVKQKLGTVIYVVTDAGSTLKSGLKKAKINHVYDITHAIALALERLYKNDADFKDYASKAGQMRFKLCCSKNAHLIPPNQRSKARFLNIDTISKWGIKALLALGRNDILIEEQVQLQWVKEKERFIIEMDALMSMVEKISIILKNEGLSKKTKSKCISILKNCKAGKLKQFKQYILLYLKENAKQISKREEKVLCCSDIIETTFGKYKNELSKNPMSGITDLVLIIPAFTSSLSIKEVNAAIGNCTVKDIEEWKKNNLCNSLLKKRNAVFKNQMAGI